MELDFSAFTNITCTTVLTANAYGARGSWPFTGSRWFEKQDETCVLSMRLHDKMEKQHGIYNIK